MPQTPTDDFGALDLPLSVAARLRLEASLTLLSESDIVITALREYFERGARHPHRAIIAEGPANLGRPPGH